MTIKPFPSGEENALRLSWLQCLEMEDDWKKELDEEFKAFRTLKEMTKEKEVTLKDYIGKFTDEISRPAHYAEGRKYEPWKVIDDWGLNYLVGSAVKYLSRYERKGTPELDLRKAIRFIEMELERRANLSRT